MRTTQKKSETWKPVPFRPFNQSHEASNRGRIRRVIQSRSHAPKIIPGCELNSGYRQSFLGHAGVRRKFLTHQLIAAAFIGPCPPDHEVNHKDLNRSNNAASNLEYVTRKENIAHSHRMGRGRTGESHGRAKLTESDVASARVAWSGGASIRSLAMKFNVSKTTMSHALKRVTWRMVV